MQSYSVNPTCTYLVLGNCLHASLHVNAYIKYSFNLQNLKSQIYPSSTWINILPQSQNEESLTQNKNICQFIQIK